MELLIRLILHSLIEWKIAVSVSGISDPLKMVVF